MLPDVKQLYAAFAAVGREALIASGALPLPWDQLFVAGLASMPVAPVDLDIRLPDKKVKRVRFQEDLSSELDTMPIKPICDSDFETADAALIPKTIREFYQHRGCCLVDCVPGMKTKPITEHSTVMNARSITAYVFTAVSTLD